MRRRTPRTGHCTGPSAHRRPRRDGARRHRIATRRPDRTAIHDASPSKPTTCRRPSPASARCAPSTASASPSRRARSSGCSGPTARARPPPCGSSPPSCARRRRGPGARPRRREEGRRWSAALIGLAGQYAAVDENLTGRENLQMVGRLNHLPGSVVASRAVELLDQFDLTDAGDRPLKTYSGGMRRRLDLAAALVARPTVLFLDEPTTGLDPQSRNDLWEVIERLVGGGHHRAAHHPVPRGGRPAGQHAGRHRPRAGHRRGHARAELKAEPGRHRARGGPARPSTTARRTADAARRPRAPRPDCQRHGGRGDRGRRARRRPWPRLRSLDQAGHRPTAFTLREPSLDDVFLALTGRRTEDETECRRGRRA